MADKELMQQALEALVYMTKGTIHGGNDLTKAAIAALRERLASPSRHISYVCPNCFWSLDERKPLTDEEIARMPWEDMFEFARCVEKAHGIKEQS